MNEDEIQANIDAALAIDSAKPDPEPDPEPTPEPEPVVEPEPEPTPDPEPTPEPEPIKEPVKEPDYKEKFSESSREAQVIAHSKKEFELQIEEVKTMPLPTEFELKGEYPDWDLMSDTEKKLATKLMHSENKEARINEITNQQKEAEGKVQERVKEIETFTIDPTILSKFPKLVGKEEEFKVFATKQTRLTLDLEDAAGLFSIQLPEPTKHKGQMFETGTGGANDKQKPKDDKISLDEAALLMKTDYRKYKEMLIANKIKLDVE